MSEQGTFPAAQDRDGHAQADPMMVALAENFVAAGTDQRTRALLSEAGYLSEMAVPGPDCAVAMAKSSEVRREAKE